MSSIAAITDFTESLTGHPLNRDEGVHFGPAPRAVSGATVCWMATPDAIRAAGQRGDDLLIGHESLYYPYDVVNRPETPDGWQEWPTNRQRRSLLAEFGLSFLRLHGSVDEICILDDFAEQLGLGAPVHNDGYVKIYEVAATSLAALTAHVKERLGMAGVRVAPAGAEERPIRRIGLPWGGMALFVNVGYQQRLIEQGCDLLIAGETDNYGFRFAQELGIPMIETSHELSENRGLAHFTQMLAQAFPAVRFTFFENPCVWQMR